MLSYAFNDILGAKVDQLTEDEFEFVWKEVCIAFAFFGKSEPVAESPEESKNEAIAETTVRADLETENKVLKEKNYLLRVMYNELLDKFIG